MNGLRQALRSARVFHSTSACRVGDMCIEAGRENGKDGRVSTTELSPRECKRTRGAVGS